MSVPWWAKFSAKLVLSRLPVDYRSWNRVGLFKHGSMDDGGYAVRVFREHFTRCWPEPPPAGFVCLEIGPGDSLYSALVARSFGAGRVYLVDAGPYANLDPEPYRQLARALSAQGLPCPSLDQARGIADILDACGATYFTDGIDGLARLDSASIDFIWSQAVLEHIRKAQFLPYTRELRRVLKPDGRASHRVDLRDHLGNALNNLRFSDALWEKDWIARSGFYTNRIRYSEMCELFRQAGFEVKVVRVDRWTELPTPRSALADAFCQLDADELRVQGFDVVLTCDTEVGALGICTANSDNVGRHDRQSQ